MMNRGILLLGGICGLAFLMLLGAQTPKVSPTAEAAMWTEIATGVEYTSIQLVQKPECGDGLLHVVRIDPQQAILVVATAKGSDGKLRSAGEWCAKERLAAAINLGMFQKDYRTHVGFARIRGGSHSRAWNHYQAALVFDPLRKGLAPARIADLDEVWVRLDAYEKDLVWLRYGQKVSIEAEALPGELLQGRISFIDYIIGDRTRTAKVRVNVENLDGRLKPGMFVRAVAEAHVGAGGRVLEQFLAGKWVCPMHHEVVRDESGDCSVCQMPLKLAEELGLTGTEGSGVEEPLVIPRTAALITGKRAIVFVAVPNTESPTYEGREIVLGPRTGEHYIVGSGLEEGEEVVVNGAFRLDSSMQILAKPSMMTMTKDILGHSGPEVVAFLGSLDGIYAAYFEMQRALGGDDFDAAKVGATHIQEALSKAEPGALSSDVRSTWDEIHKELSTVEERAQASATIKELRAEFQPISEAMLLLERRFGHSSEGTHKEAHCPMAFGNAGASWLQVGDEVYNPYYGDMMLNCGTIEKSYSAKGAQ